MTIFYLKSSFFPTRRLLERILLVAILCIGALSGRLAAQCSPDVTPPVCQAPPDVTFSCEGYNASLWNTTTATATDNCCLDPNKTYLGQIGLAHAVNYVNFDSLCHKGTITRNFIAYDCSGNSSFCSQKIVVTYLQGYYVKFPDDLFLSIFSPSGNYGQPTIHGNGCELNGISYSDQIFHNSHDTVFRLERTWTIINWCTYNPNLPATVVPNPQPSASFYNPANRAGPVVSAANTPAPWSPTQVKLHWYDPNPTDYSVYYSANANEYQYTQIIVVADTLEQAVAGRVFADTLSNCSYDAGEVPLIGWKVKGIGNVTKTAYETITDSLGNYILYIPSYEDSVRITLEVPFNFGQTCSSSYAVAVPHSQITPQDIPVFLNVNCPELVIDLGTTRLRRCFSSQYFLDVCNVGVDAVQGTYVELALDQYLSFENTTYPATDIGNNTWKITLGDLKSGECVHFPVNVYVGCSAPLGATHCSSASVYPYLPCGDGVIYTGAEIRVSGICDGDSVRMKIENRGANDMQDAADFVVVEDVVMLQGGSFQLNHGDERNFAFHATGATWRLEAGQPSGFPYGGPEVAVVEGCGGLNHPGLVNMLAVNSPNPYSTRDCTENVGALDPNEKSAVPTGYGSEHFLKPNTDIEYTIRFQNTGTDTAFTVAILDTLSDLLVPHSVRPGASSHPYSFEVLDNKVLRFHFANILLPDSTTNEPYSHGFVKFNVAQQPNNKNGTVIHNNAAIYFDYNSPVITNDVYHTIGDHFLTVSVDPGPSGALLKVFPNPTSDAAYFNLPDASARFELLDVSGQLLRTVDIHEQTWKFERRDLKAGMYFFHIRSGGQEYKGKIVVE